MNVKQVKKNLPVNKRTISNLYVNREDILRRDEQKTVNTGLDPISQVGVTRHPKYC
jgi:hypothetical protein